ncbi:RNA polymerase recycling motor ATPase HelR [Nocardioides sp. ChNu-99]|uniref:RNA polymerase recycling motor ATPase HelR n=1 Tax=Nocardioides sp. ChNu-99 TaxID=2839897 RepID=UPI002405DB5E|nr:RNA polymerase recycling motor ATPase HelR [Nocardioides sp. ChNu-99]MDF9715668.1 AAA family ATPase [Nocardioides sp. ChNu-99]
MTSTRPSAFALPDHLAAKAAPALVDDDECFLARLADALQRSVDDVSARLDATLAEAGGTGQEAMDRDLEVHRLSSRLRTLRRYGLDLCLGRAVPADGSAPTYVGRVGVSDGAGERLLVDWRSPAAEPFFGATHADPRGLVSRRRYRWTDGRVTDYWDEVFDPAAYAGHAALDDQSAFVASLGSSRSARMRDVLATLQADQDAIVRAGSRGVLVVDGGPGTGKTVVALHRTAYLLHADPRLDHRRGGVLFVGPHQPYLAYVADVLPSLGEEGVRTCTLRDLVPEGAHAAEERDPQVARLKSDAAMVDAIEPAVALYEEPPTTGMDVETPWADTWLSAAEWAEAFSSPDPGTPHNDARDQVWEALLAILVDKHDTGHDAEGVEPEQVRRALAANGAIREAFDRAWPLLEATDVVGDLWTVPAYLRRCAPWLTPEEVRALQRRDPEAWTVVDLPLLDAARLRLGDPEASRRRRRASVAATAERARMAHVVDHLVATDDTEMAVMSMLRGDDLQGALVPGADPGTVPATETHDRLAGPFAHVVVDEAQELTDAEWQVVLHRCPTRSLTVVGDRAQARHGFTGTWEERLARVGFDQVTVASLTVNYRTPAEVMAEAEPVIRAVLPDANVPTSVRRTGVPVHHGGLDELRPLLDAWLAEHAEGTACVVAAGTLDPDAVPASPRVRVLTPALVKGLEFDLVVLLRPDELGDPGDPVAAAVDRYVAMTRATQRLVVLA